MRHYAIILLGIFFLACNAKKENKDVTPADNKAQLDSNKSNDILTVTDSSGMNTAEDTAAVPPNRLIVPGKSIGLTSLNQRSDAALKNLGEPGFSDAGMGKEMMTWYSVRGTDTTSEMNIFFIRRMGNNAEPALVEYIRITSPFFSTASHIGVGSTQDQIQKYFPAIRKIASFTAPKTNLPSIIYEDDKSGISFEIDDTKKCTGIAVHKPGRPAFEAYNVHFPDIEFVQNQ